MRFCSVIFANHLQCVSKSLRIQVNNSENPFWFVNQQVSIQVYLVNSRDKGFVKGQVLGKLSDCEEDFAQGWFDHLKLWFSYKEVRFKTFCQPVKTSCPLTENANETPSEITKT